MLFDVAAAHPERTAIDDGVRRRSFAGYADRIVRSAHVLRDEFGCRPDDHIALLAGNRVECAELTLAAWLAGVWVTPVNRHCTSDEIAWITADCGARVVFADDTHRHLVAPDVPVVTIGDELDRLVAAADDAPPDLSGPAGGTMCYTSGTTGRPRGVRRARPASSHDAFAAAAATGRMLGLDGSGTHLVTGPMYHAAPLLFALYDQANGATVRVMPRWDEGDFCDTVTAHSVRATHLVPTMFVRLLRMDAARRAAFDPSSLTRVLHGAAPIAPDVKRRMIEWWGPVLVEYWGATEGGVYTLVDADEWLRHPGTVGRPLPAFDVFAADDVGTPLPPGEVGTLWCRRRDGTRAFEYHRDPAKTAGAHLDDVTFTAGDFGSVDADGRVFLADRRTNLIITGGVNVYPAEIEAVLITHPEVDDVAVVGLPDEEWGARVHAVVRPARTPADPDATAAAIIATARESLATFKVPRSISFTDDFPRTPAGKIDLRRLRGQLADDES